jgi:transglutaminase-like putative cysteine protease
MLGRYFYISSYLTVACAAAMLLVSTGYNVYMGGAFLAALIFAAAVEGKKWQLSERLGTAISLVLLGIFLFAWKYPVAEILGSKSFPEFRSLTLFLLLLIAVKLSQIKASRDWLFIYVLSFFSALLATGVGFGLLQSLLLICYLFFALTALICFANQRGLKPGSRKTSRLVSANAEFEYKVRSVDTLQSLLARRLPWVGIGLAILTLILAVPIFLLAPRFERTARARATDGVTGFVGFSGSLRLGQIGFLQQNNEVVMRVRLDEGSEIPQTLRWRGTAFDYFDGREWRRSENETVSATQKRADLFDLGTARSTSHLIGQTVFLEPINTPVLFAAPRAVAIEGTLPSVFVDSEDGLTTRAHASERISYRAHSDVAQPDGDILRADRRNYAEKDSRYLQVTRRLAARISELASEIVLSANARTRYDAAAAIEKHLRGSYSYSLDMQATGGDPLGDFLFRVRAGHCEYFASAMAVMLRTQGIASRVVNGFQSGRYNRTTGAYVVRQRDAHAWVEVYFPETATWVAFDPTPALGNPANSDEGIDSAFDDYAEALEMFWVQYVATYGWQEQRTLAGKVRNLLGGLKSAAAGLYARATNAWNEVSAFSPAR